MMTFSEAGRRLALSFVTAFVLWAFVSVTQNPEDHKIFDVPVQLQNIPPDLVVVDDAGMVVSNFGTVQVEVWAAMNTLNQLRDGDLKAVVDVSKATTAVQKFPVTIINSRTGMGYMSFKYAPQLELRLDEMNTVELPIRVEMQTNAASSVAFDTPKAEIVGVQKTVSIQAPQMLLKRIKEAKVKVEFASTMTANYVSSVPVVVVDDAGKPISGVTLSPSTVEVNIEVRPKTGIKEVVILPQITGYVASGYRIREVRLAHATVSITGGSEVVEKTMSVTTAPIDVSNLSESITQTVQVIFPNNILPIKETDTMVDVGLRLELVVQPVRMRIPVVVTLDDIPEGLDVSVVPNVVTIEVLASPAALQRGALTLIRASAVVGGWDGNNRYRQVLLALPDDVKLMGNAPVVQLFVNEIITPEPTNVPVSETATVTILATPTGTVTPTKTTP